MKKNNIILNMVFVGTLMALSGFSGKTQAKPICCSSGSGSCCCDYGEDFQVCIKHCLDMCEEVSNLTAAGTVNPTGARLTSCQISNLSSSGGVLNYAPDTNVNIRVTDPTTGQSNTLTYTGTLTNIR